MLSLPTDVNIRSERLSLSGLSTDTRPKKTPNRKLIPSFKIGGVSKCGWRDNTGATQQHDTESKHWPTQHNRDTTKVFKCLHDRNMLKPSQTSILTRSKQSSLDGS